MRELNHVLHCCELDRALGGADTMILYSPAAPALPHPWNNPFCFAPFWIVLCYMLAPAPPSRCNVSFQY